MERRGFKSKEEYNAYMREWRRKNREKSRTYNREYNRLWRKKNGNEATIKWNLANPEKRKAQDTLRRAVRKGAILKRPCEKCGSEQSVGHHPDYSKPLAVIWLCKVHHREVHYTVDKTEQNTIDTNKRKR